jgi:diketogulonate reductase-like aldo/keto reductase
VWELRGKGGPVCNQVLYHPGERAVEHALLPWREKRGIAVVAYIPFGHGRFPTPNTKGGLVQRESAAGLGATARQVALRFPDRRGLPARAAPPGAADPLIRLPSRGGPARLPRRLP